MTNQILLIIQIIFGLITISLIILQSKGTGIGSTFGGDMGFYGTKRGAERLLFIITIISSAIFLGSSLAGAIF